MPNPISILFFKTPFFFYVFFCDTLKCHRIKPKKIMSIFSFDMKTLGHLRDETLIWWNNTINHWKLNMIIFLQLLLIGKENVVCMAIFSSFVFLQIMSIVFFIVQWCFHCWWFFIGGIFGGVNFSFSFWWTSIKEKVQANKVVRPNIQWFEKTKYLIFDCCVAFLFLLIMNLNFGYCFWC